MEIGIIIVPKAILYELSCEEGNNDEYSNTADEVLSGWAVGILEKKGAYLKVITHYGYEGLLKGEVLTPGTKQELINRDERQESYIVTFGCVDLMSIPSVKGRIIETLYAGSFVAVTDETDENGYRKVRTADGNLGYLPAVSITKRKDSDAFLYEEAPWDFLQSQRSRLSLSEDAFRSEVTECARRYLGTQYRWGGKTTDGIDCSGMTFMSYLMCGVLIYRDAKIEKDFPVKQIPVTEIKKGDLLYFPGHIAMYLGNNQYIHATAYKEAFRCTINSLSPTEANYREDLVNKLEAAGSIFG